MKSMRWLGLLSMLGGCLFAPSNDVSGFDYEWILKDDNGAPGPMHGAKLTYARGQRNTIVMYAGRDTNAAGGAPSGKVWKWKDSKWSEICQMPDPETGTLPDPVYLPGFTWVDETKTLMLAGGARIAPGQPQLFNDVSNQVWTCDESDTWHKAGTLVNGRVGASLLEVNEPHEVRLVGGRDAAKAINSMEASPTSGSSWSIESDMPFPSAGAGQTATYDSNGAHVVALEAELTPDNSITPHDAIWVYTGTWAPYCTDCSGIGRSDASIVHVEGTQNTYVIGGYIGNGNNTSGTWILDSNRLVKVDSEPVERNAMGVASTFRGATTDDSLISYGGTTPNSICATNECADTYEYDTIGR
jgi:hypothetical protein